MNFDDLRLILVPTDFSKSTAASLQAAIRLAQVFHASIQVFHVDLDPSLMLPAAENVFPPAPVFEQIVAAAAKRLSGIVEEVRMTGVACTSASELGRTSVAIAEQARRSGAGLIVMGSHGRHGLSHALLGSIAEKVVQHAPCPVLVIPDDQAR